MANTTWNSGDIDDNLSLSNGDLTVTVDSTESDFNEVRAVQGFDSGKYYFEVTFAFTSTNLWQLGIASTSADPASFATYWEADSRGVYFSDNNKFSDGSSGGAYLSASDSSPDTYGVYVDLDANTIGFIDNDGSDLGTAYSDLSGITWYPFVRVFASGSIGETATANFGDSAFTHSVPSGYTAGWPAPVTADGDMDMAFNVTATMSNQTKRIDGDTAIAFNVQATAQNNTKRVDASPAIAFNVQATGANQTKRADTVDYDMDFYVSGEASKLISCDVDVDASFTITSTATLTSSFVGDFDLPQLTTSGTIIQGELLDTEFELPGLRMESSTVLNGQVINDSPATLPALTVSGTIAPRWDIDLPSVTVTGQIVTGGVMTLARDLPALTLTGEVDITKNLTADFSLPILRTSGTILTGGVLTSTATLPAITLSAGEAYAGGVLTGSVSLPVFTLTGEFLGNWNITSNNIELPVLTTTGTILTPLGATYTVYSLNTDNFEVTNYSNYNFDQVMDFNGVPYGVKSDGIYELTGDDDDGTDIDAEFLLGFTDFGEYMLKRMDQLYIGYKSDGCVYLLLDIENDENQRSYFLKRGGVDSITGLRNARVTPGRGLKSTYWQLGVRNYQGSDFEIDRIGALTSKLSRNT